MNELIRKSSSNDQLKHLEERFRSMYEEKKCENLSIAQKYGWIANEVQRGNLK